MAGRGIYPNRTKYSVHTSDSQHLVWALRLIYWEQKGQIITKQDTSREFDIKAGVRQGCVLSSRLFSCVLLEVPLKKGREKLQDGGLDLGDGGIPLLDLRLLMTVCCWRHLPLKQPGWWMHWQFVGRRSVWH